MRFGMSELLVVLLIVFVLFGARRLPQLGHDLGAGLRSLKRAMSGGSDVEASRELPPGEKKA